VFSRFHVHLRQQFVGYVALFVALGGTGAYAANTVFSEDIVDGQVKTPDLAAKAVTDSKLGEASVATDRLKDNAVTGRKVLDNTLKGADVDESSLVLDEARAISLRVAAGTIEQQLFGGDGLRIKAKCDDAGGLTIKRIQEDGVAITRRFDETFAVNAGPTGGVPLLVLPADDLGTGLTLDYRRADGEVVSISLSATTQDAAIGTDCLAIGSALRDQ
jgi:hypothetical protein